MKKISLKLLSSVALICLLFSCNKNSSSGQATQPRGISERSEEERQEGPPAVDGSNIDGLYVAKFQTINPTINGTVPGSASFLRKDDKFMAYIRLFAGFPKAWHMQFVYEGSRCPEMSDDTNDDGIIDIAEAEAVLGKILIPLDSDLSSQASGRRFFPLADLSGSYQYERVTSFRRFLNDLQSPNKDPTGEMTKLAPGEGLSIVGKAVLILGIGEETQLPQTVATKGRHKPFQTIPVACGIYKKIDEIPGTTHNDSDQIPGPIAEVEDGQDRPASENIPETPTGPTRPENDGRTNDSEDGQGPVSDGDSSPRTTPAPTPAPTTPTPEVEERPSPRPRPTPAPTPSPSEEAEPVPETNPTPTPQTETPDIPSEIHG